MNVAPSTKTRKIFHVFQSGDKDCPTRQRNKVNERTKKKIVANCLSDLSKHFNMSPLNVPPTRAVHNKLASREKQSPPINKYELPIKCTKDSLNPLLKVMLVWNTMEQLKRVVKQRETKLRKGVMMRGETCATTIYKLH